MTYIWTVGLALTLRYGVFTSKRLIEILSTLQYGPDRRVLKVDADEDVVGGDDAADALRYLVATKPRRVVERRLAGW